MNDAELAESYKTALNMYLNKLMTRLTGENLPRLLFHYTAPTTMREIILSGRLRAYHVNNMNDFSEGRYAASVMRAVLDRRFATESDPSALEFFEAVRNRFTTFNPEHLFSLSFSSLGDERGMWQLYAKRGTGFSFAVPLHLSISWAAFGHQGMLLKCCYDAEELTRTCGEILDFARVWFVIERSKGRALDSQICADLLLKNISWLAFAFKPSVWRDEHEWRYIFWRTNNVMQENGRSFIELPLSRPDNSNPIVALCGGPTCDYEDHILPVQQALYERGYGQNFPVHLARNHTTRPGRRPPTLSIELLTGHNSPP